MATRTCYRHTSRPTGTSCTRCERPICPECMIEAPVGHHCPTCVNESRTQMRQVKRVQFPRGMMAGRGGAVCLALVAINVVVYLVDASSEDFFLRYADNALLVALRDEYYRMFTAAFLHANLLHLGFNMFALYTFGSQLEAALGSFRFLPLYVMSALGGSVASNYVGHPIEFSVGASGAVFGLLGAYYVTARSRGLETRQVLGLIVINLVIGSVIPNIDNAAHVGGLVTGGLIALVYQAAQRQPQRSRLAAEVGGVLLIAAVIVGATMLRVEQLRSEYPFLPGISLGFLPS